MIKETEEKRVNVDPLELEKFSQLAHRWWDSTSEFKPLHDINPLRLDYIDRTAGLSGKAVLDVGCGGGILAEAMARRGAAVTGIDLSEKGLRVAQLHLHESRLQIASKPFCASLWRPLVPALSSSQPHWPFGSITQMSETPARRPSAFILEASKGLRRAALGIAKA